jgi:diguanylate cyclase (GGDEF)-like protein
MSMNPPTAADRAAVPSIEQEELRGISSTVAQIHWLLLVLVLVFEVFGDTDPGAQAAIISASTFYGVFVIAFRYTPFYKHESRWKVALETWGMIGFITWVCYFTGGLASPLLNTFLLPVITAALILGKVTTLIEVALIAACQVFLGGSFSMATLLTLAFLGGFTAQIAPVILVAYIVSMFAVDIRFGLTRAKMLSETDELTGLLNIRGFATAANLLFGQALRYRRAAAVLMIDSDNLKKVNDAFGHEAGNQLLRQVARLVQAQMRYTDVLARYGGDEFIVLLPETPAAGALEVATRICAAIASTPLERDGKRLTTTTVSIGVSIHPADGDRLDTLVARADEALYQAKQGGRNRVALFQAKTGEEPATVLSFG